MIQIYLFISTLGILFVIKYLVWFLDDNYEMEERIIKNLIARREYRTRINHNKPECAYRDILSSRTRKEKYIKDSGIEFYSFTEDSTETDSDNSNSQLSGKCA